MEMKKGIITQRQRILFLMVGFKDVFPPIGTILKIIIIIIIIDMSRITFVCKYL